MGQRIPSDCRQFLGLHKRNHGDISAGRLGRCCESGCLAIPAPIEIVYLIVKQCGGSCCEMLRALAHLTMAAWLDRRGMAKAEVDEN